MDVSVDDSHPLALGVLHLEDCQVDAGDDALGAAFDDAENRVRARYAPESFASSEAVQRVRRLFRSVGIDPTRYRPAGEALARRALKGQALYRVNNLVDVNNICSMDSLLPVGSYDAEHVRGDVVVRMGRDGEHYEGISKALDIAGKLASVDDEGPFGSPIADSRRTRIRDSTRRVLVLVYAPADAGDADLESVMDRYAALAATHARARVERRRIVRA